MFKKAVYKNHIYHGCIRDERKVLNDFIKDLEISKPVFVGNNQTRIFVSFQDFKHLISYELPIKYKYLLNR